MEVNANLKILGNSVFWEFECPRCGFKNSLLIGHAVFLASATFRISHGDPLEVAKGAWCRHCYSRYDLLPVDPSILIEESGSFKIGIIGSSKR